MRHEGEREGRRWLAQAGRDLGDARFALDGGRYHLACFLAQQAAEKAVAGYLYCRGAEDVWGHALADLCEDAAVLDQGFHALKSVAVFLDKYLYITRYPRYLPAGIPADAFDQQEAQRALALADEVLGFVRERLAVGAAG